MILRMVGGTLALCALAWLISPWIAQIDASWGFRLPTIATVTGVLLIAGANGLMYFAQNCFVREGGGSGVPGHAPRRLVVAGPYRWVRNPLYLSGNSILFGIALVLTSPTLVLGTCTSVLLFHFFIILIEEPRLIQRYGDDYRMYQRAAPRWIPRRPKS
jgi:protein-S-isoprenylcysteine O-methyltransferase Ste14